MPWLSEIHRYPIKSTAGESCESAVVFEEGLVHDRRFMLVRTDGVFVTARRYPQLQRVFAHFDGAHLMLIHDDHPAQRSACRDFEQAALAVEIWSDCFTAWTTTPALDAWFSRIVGIPVRLVWLGTRSRRQRAGLDHPVSLADGYPLLLIGEASLADLNARTASGDHGMAQFRPNLVVTGAEAFAEDGWQRIAVGETRLRVAGPCARCVMTTVDPATGTRRLDGEPMQTLAGYRRHGRDVMFGQNLVVERGGRIRRGDPVTVLT